MIEKDVTLLILTHERKDFLIRALEYYEQFNLPIVIADSSTDNYKLKEHDNLIYYHTPNISFHEKFILTVARLNTKYVHLCSDDDFSLFDAIKYSYQTLEEDDTISTIQGRSIGFQFTNNKLETQPIYFYTHRDLSNNSYDLRINSLMNIYFHNFYSLHRTENLKLISNYKQKYNIYDNNLTERLIMILSLSFGKHKLLNKLHNIRDMSIAYKDGNSNDTRKTLEYYYYQDKEEIDNFKKAIQNFLIKEKNIQKDIAKEQVTNWIDTYLESWVKNRYKYFDITPSSKFELFIKKFICKISTSKLCQKINTYHWQYRKEQLIKKAKTFNAYPYKYEDKSWKQIEEKINNTKEIYDKY